MWEKIDDFVWQSPIYIFIVALTIILDIYLIARGQTALGFILLSTQIPWIAIKILRYL